MYSRVERRGEGGCQSAKQGGKADDLGVGLGEVYKSGQMTPFLLL